MHRPADRVSHWDCDWGRLFVWCFRLPICSFTRRISGQHSRIAVLSGMLTLYPFPFSVFPWPLVSVVHLLRLCIRSMCTHVVYSDWWYSTTNQMHVGQFKCDITSGVFLRFAICLHTVHGTQKLNMLLVYGIDRGIEPQGSSTFE
jgi:hypothetical protein